MERVRVNRNAVENPIELKDKLRKISDLPGPRALPLVGNFHQMEKGAGHRSIEAWAREFGDYYRLSLGRRDMLVVSDPTEIGRILRDRPDGFRRTQLLEMVLGEIGIGGVFASNGEVWRRQRKMVASAFDPKHIKAYFPSLARVTERLYRRWSNHAAKSIEFDLQADLMLYTVDVVAGLAFGVDINTIESDRETIQTHLNYVLPMMNRRLGSIVRYWHWFKLPSDRKLDIHLAQIQRAVTDLIQQARQRMAENPSLREAPTNLLEAMLAERDAPGTELTDHDVSSNVVTILLAGEDTTANTLAWLVYLVSHHPEVMQRLAQETDELLGESRWAERMDVATSHSYVAACAQETMRVKPVAPMLLFEALAPTVIGDIAVPAGAGVLALLRGPTMDQRYFDRPREFDPDRWSAPRDASRQASAAGTPGRERVSMPFGAGPRICPGRNLAMLEISLVTSMLFRNFQIKSLRTPDGTEVKESLSFTMGPSKMLVTLAPRH
jgi:cytochrome P450